MVENSSAYGDIIKEGKLEMPASTIALVDPDATFLDETAKMLQEAGYATRAYSTLTDTYNALYQNRPDAVMIELHFPDSKHGIDLVTLLKLRPETRELPIIMVSTDIPFLSACGERLRERAVPAVWTLPKPLDPAEVLRVLHIIVK